MGELLRTLKERGVAIEEVPLAPGGARRTHRARRERDDQQLIAKDVFAKMYDVGPIGG